VVPFLLFAIALLGISLVVAWRFMPELVTGRALADTDAYMRLVRVRHLAMGGGWFDSGIPRSNWPVGETLHWTRPLDVLLLASAWLLTPLLGFGQALHLAGVALSPILLVALFGAVAWAAEPLVGRDARGLAMLVLLAQPTVMSYALPGRPDHHALILLCFGVSLGFMLRGLADPSARHWAWGLGVSAAMGLWVSPEFLLPVALYLGAGMAVWVVQGGRLAAFQRTWTGVCAMALLVVLSIERGPDALAVEYDRVSVVHVLVAALAWGVWWVLAIWQRRTSDSTPPRRSPISARLGGGMLAGGLALAVMAAAFPRFFGGPMVDVTDPVMRMWLSRVTELQPVLLPTDARGAGLLLANAGSALVALPMLVYGLRRDARLMAAPPSPRSHATSISFLLFVGIVGCLALALAQVRWITYVQVMSALPLAMVVVRVRGRWPGEAPTAMAKRAFASAGLIAGPLLAGAALFQLGPADRARGGEPACDPEAVASYLATDSHWRDAPRTIAAYTDLGPVILYRSHHRVLATPYHRNQQGIRAVYDLLSTIDDERALALAREGSIDLILLCPRLDRAFFVPEREGRTTLYGRLVTGTVPAWLRPVPAADVPPGVRVYEVRPGPE
jgi:hypothetical protein